MKRHVFTSNTTPRSPPGEPRGSEGPPQLGGDDGLWGGAVQAHRRYPPRAPPAPAKISKNENAHNFSPQTPKRQPSSAKCPQQPRGGLQQQIEVPGRTSIPKVYGNFPGKKGKKRKRKPNQNERVGHASSPHRSSTTWRCGFRHKMARLMRKKPRNGLKTFFTNAKNAATEQNAAERALKRRNCAPVSPTTSSKRTGGRQAKFPSFFWTCTPWNGPGTYHFWG